jgi:hypothetical protein
MNATSNEKRRSGPKRNKPCVTWLVCPPNVTQATPICSPGRRVLFEDVHRSRRRPGHGVAADRELQVDGEGRSTGAKELIERHEEALRARLSESWPCATQCTIWRLISGGGDKTIINGNPLMSGSHVAEKKGNIFLC